MLPGWGPSFIILYTPRETSSNTIWHHNTVPRIWARVSKLTANNRRQTVKALTALLPEHCNLSITNNYKTLTHRFPSKTVHYHKNRKQLFSSSTLRNAPSIAFVSAQDRHFISEQHRDAHSTGRVVEVLTKRQGKEKRIEGKFNIVKTFCNETMRIF
jgi:hypothetical protein